MSPDEEISSVTAAKFSVFVPYFVQDNGTYVFRLLPDGRA